MYISPQGESGPSSDPETTLFLQAQAGCADSLNQLLIRHERFVHWVVWRQRLCGLAYDEAVQAGRFGLWRAVLGFDLQRRLRFSTYASKAIMAYVWAAVESYRVHLRKQIPYPLLIVYFHRLGSDPAQMREWQEIRDCLQQLVERLPERLSFVIRTYYGLDGNEPRTLQSIGHQLGLTRERVRQLRNEALVWLRQPAHNQELCSLLALHNHQQYEMVDQLAQALLRRRGGSHARC